jgi:hypothetical protein
MSACHENVLIGLRENESIAQETSSLLVCVRRHIRVVAGGAVTFTWASKSQIALNVWSGRSLATLREAAASEIAFQT